MTIINRRTFVAGRGKWLEAIELLSERAKDLGFRYRIYSSHYGSFDAIALEVEFESIGQMEDAWSVFFSASGVGEFMAKWYAATTTGGANEVWLLEANG